jgi:hypothetical protein
MENCDDEKGKNGMTIKILSGVVSLGIILILGAYGYTWSEMKSDQDEKREWRQEHQRVLDKRFEEIKQGQEKLGDKFDKNTNDTKDILQEILVEQRQMNRTNVNSKSRSSKADSH